MAVTIPRFTASDASSGLSGVGAGLGGGIADLITGNREKKEKEEADAKLLTQQENKQRVLTEGSQLAEILRETSPTLRTDLISRFAQNAQPAFRQELEQFSNLPFEQQDSMGRASLVEDGLERLITKGVDAIDKDFLTEERRVGTATVKELKKRAAVINTSFGKIEGLVNQLESGTGGRAAQGAAIMNLARLISPGVVTDNDFRSLSGAANPTALALGMIAGRDEDVARQIQRFYDPTNPELSDPQNILDIANSVVGAEAPAIIQGFVEAKSRGERAGLNKRQFNTIFADSKAISSLSRFKVKDISLKSDFEKLSEADKVIFMKNATDEEKKEAGL